MFVLRHIKKIWQWYAGQYRGRWYQRIAITIATLFVSAFMYLGMVDINLFGLFGLSPTMEKIQNPIINEASLIYSSDSVLIGKYYNENRSPVKFEDISPYVIDALISTEDERFYLHHGIDYQGLFAAVKDMATGSPRGASTITQQLVKNMFKIRSQYSTGVLGNIPGVKMLIMKSKEWITAVKIENMYSKKDILTLYLNTVDFGCNSFGIKTAAKTYFNTTPAHLTAEQAAVLVGLLKATTTYNPKVNPDRSLERRNVVLHNMLKHGHITQAECDSLTQTPLNLHYTSESTYEGSAQYFRQAVQEHLSDWCQKHNIDLYSDGLTIYTSIDSRMQQYAEEAVQQQMRIIQQRFNSVWGTRAPWRDEYGREIKDFIDNLARKTDYYKYLDQRYDGNPDSIAYYLNLPHTVRLFDYDAPRHTIEREISTMDSIRYMVAFMHCGLVAIEPDTRHVKAWVGDINFDSWKYDKVKAMRQPGSTFKLFVYAAAFEHDDSITPTKHYTDSEISLRVPDKNNPKVLVPWTPHNANGRYSGASMPLKRAFALSVNTIAVKLSQEIGIDRVINIAHAMGVNSKIDRHPAIALGASDVNLLEMTNAYSTVMDDGTMRTPVLVTKIIDRDGEVLYDSDRDDPSPRRAMKYKTAFYMQRLLWSGVNEGGTSSALNSYCYSRDTEWGGKTGTSNNHSDAWFVGCSPGLVVGSWVGGEYRSIHFQTGAQGQGSRTALPIVGDFLRRVMSEPRFHRYHQRFPKMKEDIPAHTYMGNGTPLLADTIACDSDSITIDRIGADNIIYSPDDNDTSAGDDYGTDLSMPADNNTDANQ